MKIHDVEQGSPEWFDLRAGKPTASMASSLITPGKLDLSASIPAYANHLAAEIYLGSPIISDYQSRAMERGQELEGVAIEDFSFLKETDVAPAGFITDAAETMGCSPDGMGDGFGVEAKCPDNVHYHVDMARHGHNSDLARRYRLQIQMSLFVTGLDRWFLHSYYPSLPSVTLELKPDPKVFDALELALEKLFAERAKALESIQSLSGLERAA